MKRLEGKTAIITGAAGGIGLATAAAFVEQGANVMLVDLSEPALIDAVRQLGEKSAACLALDVTTPDSARRYVDATLARFGRVDIALLNAGIEGIVSPISDTPLENFDRVLATNVRSVFIGLAAVMPVMKRDGGGSIVITSSIAGFRGSPGMAPYSTSKHAVIGLMRTAALEGAVDKIRVNTVNPAPIDTRMMASIVQGRVAANPQAARSRIEASIPMKRYGTAEEVASLMLFLASDESSFCSGGTYQIDGGMIAGLAG